MTDQSSAAPHQPGVYVKGETERIATTAGQATAFAFDGYVLRDESQPEPEVSDEKDEDASGDNPLAPETDSGLPADPTPTATPTPSGLFGRTR